MKIEFRGWMLGVAALLALVGAGAGSAADTGGGASAYAPGIVLAQPKAGVADALYARIVTEAGGSEGEREPHGAYRMIHVPEGQERAVAEALSLHPLIEWAQVDGLQKPQAMPLEYRIAAEWQSDMPANLACTDGNGCRDHWAMNTFSAWDVTRGAGQLIAIIDSGVNAEDPNLIGQIAPGGWNFAKDSADTGPTGSKHGTWVSRTAVGRADNEGPLVPINPHRMPDGRLGWATTNRGDWKVGVAPEAKIVPYVTSGWDHHCMAALARARESGLRIANISSGLDGAVWAGPGKTAAAASFRAAGGVVVNSAGNEEDSTPQGQFAEDAFVFVGALRTGTRGSLAIYSNRGPSLDFCAPEFIGNYGGTSNAAPAVAGTIALVWSVNPDFLNIEVEQILKDAAGGAAGERFGSADCVGKILNAGAAVALAVERSRAAGAADLMPPRVEFARDDPALVNGAATVDVSAGDDRGVAKVVLLADDQPIGEDVTAPYGFALDGPSLASRGLRAGSLVAVAYDFSGKSTRSAARPYRLVSEVEDNEAPVVEIYDAKNRRSVEERRLGVGRLFRATFRARDDVRLDSVRGYVDGQPAGQVEVTAVQRGSVSGGGELQTLRWTLDTRGLRNGWHTVTAVAMDGLGQTANAALRIRVRNRR